VDKKFIFIFLFLLLIPSLLPAQNQDRNPPAMKYQGFGAATPGGSGGSKFRVTNLNDSGQGSLREALSKGNRRIVFDVSGEIILNGGYVPIRGAFITIDGFTAPSRGITIRNGGIEISGKKGAHDIIVRGIRIRNSDKDGIRITNAAYNVVIDHVSIHGTGDGTLDITEGTHDVTVSWSIFAEPASGKTMLIDYNPSSITLHHNLFVKGRTRNPQVRIGAARTSAGNTTLDMRNNAVWGWGSGHGTLIRYGPRVNVVNNFYSNPNGSRHDKKQALVVCQGDGKETPENLSSCGRGEKASRAWSYVVGNLSADALDMDINAVGNQENSFPAPPVDTQDACTAAQRIRSGAGARPLDGTDQDYISLISLPPCSQAHP
jgi:pectate lyase